MRLTKFLLLLALLAFAAEPGHAQGGLTRYVYDDNGRLRAVIAPNGEANIYEYDGAGNITAIRRNTANTLEILSFSPREGAPGTQVTIVGTGFGSGVNSVSFNGMATQIVSVNAPVVIATVPNGATTGPITVTTPSGSATSSQNFTVEGVVVMPANETVVSGQSIQFAATAVITGDQSVIWSVDGIDGGSLTVGVITPTGFYTAPVLLPGQQSVIFRIRARSVAAPSLVGEAVVRVINPDYARAVTGASVTVRLLPPTGILPVSPVSSGLTVRIPPPTGALPVSPISSGITVRLSPSSGLITTGPVSRSVTISPGPSISTVSPGAFARSTTAAITINGINFAGATAIRFIDGNGAVDPNITFSGLNVSGDGTSLTASITVGATAALGPRLVVVLSPSGHSQTGNTGSNTIQIVQ